MSLVAAGCGDDDDGDATAAPDATTAAGNEPRETKTIQYIVGAAGALSPLYAPMTAAIELGYFAEEGIEIELFVAEGAVAGMAGLIAGQGNYAAVVPAAQLENGDDNVVTACNWASEIHWEVAAAADSPVSTFDDIAAGDVIGVGSMGESQVVGLRRSLELRGLQPDTDVAFQPVGRGATVGEALNNGDIDVFGTWDVARASVEIAGYDLKVVESPSEWADIVGTGIATSREYLESNREEVIGFCRAFLKGNLFAWSNPEAALDLHWQYSPESKPPGTEEEAVTAGLAQLTARLEKSTPCGEATCDGWMPGSNDPEDWAATAEFMQVEADPANFYADDLVEEINDYDREAVITAAEDYEAG